MFETIISGVLVFVIGQTILKLVVEPIHALKRTFGDISHGLRVSAPFLYRPNDLPDEIARTVQSELLSLSGKLSAALMLVPGYSFWRRVFFLPGKAEVNEAASGLITMSNLVNSGGAAALEQIIKEVQDTSDLLGIYIPPHSRVSDELLQLAIRHYLGIKAPDEKVAHDAQG
ncbi:MAG: hypothetical protein VX549_09045 [Pseudomonadota bacterium]|nr:hypothetical protein [Pseudomonadota bacterium]